MGDSGFRRSSGILREGSQPVNGSLAVGRRCDWVATVSSDRSTSALHRIPPGANAAHTLVIAVDHLQRAVVRLRSWHRGIWRRWSLTQPFEQPLVPPKAGDGFQLDRLPAGADFAATPSMLDQEVRRRAHVE